MRKSGWIWFALLAPLVLTLSGQPSASNINLGSEAQQQSGKVLYDKYCAQCHGLEGDGQGYGALFMRPQPRDFTSGKFKVRTTPSGALPTDDDLRKIIRDGMPYTTMIGWEKFRDQDVDNLIYYLKTLSDDFSDPNYYEPAIPIPEPPAFSTESAEQGREVYVQMGCRRCHGEYGRGDGPSAPSLLNDAGETLLPADLTKRWTFRGGPTRQDIYRTFTTGLNGTPMPSYADSLTDQQRWQLVDYVYSLGSSDQPHYAEHVVSKSIEGELDLAQGAAIFEQAETAFFPLVGQIIEPGRAFHPVATGIEVKAVHNEQHIAFLLRWSDTRADVAGRNGPQLEVPEGGEAPAAEPAGTEPDIEANGDAAESTTAESGGDFWGTTAEEPEVETPPAGGDFWGGSNEAVSPPSSDVFAGESQPTVASVADSEFSDAVAIQFPSALPQGVRLPYFVFGDVENAVDIWFADLAQQEPQRFSGRGSGSLTAGDPEGLEMTAKYEGGAWTVIFKRERRLEDAMSIDEGQWYPVAFSVWDGWSQDRGNKRALSRWFYTYVESSEKVGPAVPMTKAALATLGIEILLVVWIRRKYRHRVSGGELAREKESPS